jgi:hypothetical protein
MYGVIDNFLPTEDAVLLYQYCISASYEYGEKDGPGTPPTGMVHTLDMGKDAPQKLMKSVASQIKEVATLGLVRAYVNCFAPSENPYFHRDGNSGITVLYYSNLGWSLDMGGETQILINDQITGILPLPNRAIFFDANLLHKATTFRDSHRFTVALKYV